jgi:AcrR family transcriptional regulator
MVLDAARAIFAEGGFSDASMNAIAERAGVSKAVLYDCYPGGKQEIYFAMLDQGEKIFLDHMTEVLDHTNRLPLEDALREGLSAFLNYAEVNPLGFRIAFGEPGTSDPEIARRSTQIREFMVRKMGERTRQILLDAGLPIPPIVDVYNRVIVAIAEELAHWALREPELPRAQAVEAVVQWLMKGFERIVPGDSWRKAVDEPTAT